MSYKEKQNHRQQMTHVDPNPQRDIVWHQTTKYLVKLKGKKVTP